MVYTVGDVARICGVAPLTARRWIDSGLLPGWRDPDGLLGHSTRVVRRDDLADFLDEHGILEHIPKVSRYLLHLE